jgi:hypothetical protein
MRLVQPGFCLLALVVVSGAAQAQLSVRQTLKDVWVASSGSLFQVDYNGVAGGGLVRTNPGETSRSFQALAFELPTLSRETSSARNLVAVDGTTLRRYADGANGTPPESLFDAGGAPSSLKVVNTVAVTPAGTVLFSGYSKPKRVFELWELDPALPVNHPQRVRLKVTGAPQLTDTVFVPAEDVVDGSVLSGGGLLAVGGKQLLFFPTNQSYLTFQLLFDSRQLGVKTNTLLTSADLVRTSDTLMIATSERTLLTTSVTPGAVTKFATLPSIPCGNLKTQRVLVRTARSGEIKTSIVSDICGQVLRYDYANAATTLNTPSDTQLSSQGLLALAVGEGNQVLCFDSEPCELTDGFTAEIQTQFDSELLVLQFNDLCDRRVAGAACTVGEVDADNALNFNSLLPLAIQAQLAAEGVTITIPPYMFGAGFNGRFGALIVRPDDIAAVSTWLVHLEIQELLGFELGVSTGLPRTTPTLDLLNQDVAAYAPDSSAYPTVRGFEATPSVTGSGSLSGSLRGGSAIIYGLQYDLQPAGPRSAAGGLSLDWTVQGSPPSCELAQGSQQFTPIAAAEGFFANLAACLFADEEELLRSVIPNGAFFIQANRTSLLHQLGLVEDKLIKALNASGPNSGSETFQAVISQLDHFDDAVAATSFTPQYVIYRNELQARSEVFRFHLLERTYPSLPPGGF